MRVCLSSACQDDREILENYEMEFSSDKSKKMKDKAAVKVQQCVELRPL